MENKILNEVRRIGNLMGNENILSEQIVPKILKKFFSVLDDDAARQVLKATDNSQDDLIRKLRAGESLSDDAMELLLKVIDYDLLAKNLVDQKLLGDRLNANIEKIINVLKENPGRYDELTKRMDEAIETMGLNNEFPDELISAVKKDVKGRIDDGIGNASKTADDMNIDDIIGQISKKSSNINNIDDFRVSLKEFLTKNRSRLTPMFTSRDIDRYVEEITGQLDVLLSKGKNSKKWKDAETIWSKLPLSEKEKLATESIEKITKKLPLSLQNLYQNPRRLVKRLINGSDGQFSFTTFIKNVGKVWLTAIMVQLLSKMLKATDFLADESNGKEMNIDNFIQYVLDGDSWSEFLMKLSIPPIMWVAEIKALPDRDKNYQEIKDLLPPSYRDNFYNDGNGNYYVRKAKVKYPVYLMDNKIGMVIDGVWYPLEEIEF